jgi:uncharacterized tellurite resistance protein B-like protein
LALYFFGFALCLIPITLAAGALQAGFRFLRRLATLRRARFTVSAREARPGDTIEASAQVVPRSSRAVTVEARLTCTMFDHRAHELYSSKRPMLPAASAPHQYSAALVLPPYALQTGRMGDKSPNPFSEHAHRMLVVWTVDFEVRSARGTLLHRRSHAFEVPRGRRLKTHLRRMSLLAIDTFSSTRNDMLFNWLVHLAACDGPITPSERTLLYELLSEMDGMTDLEEAVTRVERELQRRLVIDDVFLHRYVPMEARLEFYRALYTLALSDGPLHELEKTFLAESLKSFGLNKDDVKQIEGEVAVAREAVSAS